MIDAVCIGQEDFCGIAAVNRNNAVVRTEGHLIGLGIDILRVVRCCDHQRIAVIGILCGHLTDTIG